jgi:hypothetical protein
MLKLLRKLFAPKGWTTNAETVYDFQPTPIYLGDYQDFLQTVHQSQPVATPGEATPLPELEDDGFITIYPPVHSHRRSVGASGQGIPTTEDGPGLRPENAEAPQPPYQNWSI